MHFGFFFEIATLVQSAFSIDTVPVLDQGSYGITVELPHEIRWKCLVWFAISSNRQTHLPREQFSKNRTRIQ